MQLNLSLAIAGALVLVVGLVSEKMKHTIVSELMVSVTLGIIVGPMVLNIIEVQGWGDHHTIIEEAARITLAIGLMGVGLRLSPNDFRTLARPVAVVLTLGMLGMWLCSAALAGWIFDLPLWTALLIGAVMTPTDPIVSSNIVTGKFAKERLPARVRAALSLESGANDGLAFVIVLLPLLVLAGGEGTIREWFVTGILLGVGLAAVLGVALGASTAWLFGLAQRKGIIENYSVLTFTLALTIFTLGAARLLGGDALISVFVAGIAFNLVSDTGTKQEEENVQEAINHLITPPIFVLFGAALPWQEWQHLGWPILAFAAGILIVRRPPVFLMLFPLMRGHLIGRDLAFLAWFGPIGISGLFYSLFALSHGGDPLVWQVASAAVLASVFAHGASAAPVSRMVYRRKL
ncbi:cation:proton antiporter [Chelativorans salis]|uniref:Cation:proton antiporter n=1 Tax=Chelativorans salis TaxID=2978478 RepID=A0ABT2LUC7_9HYPH|nr:cation:proton antiporter [Chelativorans sp. EGI FJ00035]MCT7377986.1 cation:proton antiporter [Chelativorans sp. EGI FJ00035]